VKLIKYKGKDLKKINENYFIIPYIERKLMYGQVWSHLGHGGCLGIFPEGGSHDNPNLLPLKAGICLMALGAM